MRKTKFHYIFSIITAVVFTLLSACVNTNDTNASHETEAERNKMAALDKAGVAYVNFESKGWFSGGFSPDNWRNEHSQNLLYIDDGVLMFGKYKMQFLYRANDSFTFYNAGSHIRISFNENKGIIEASESNSYTLKYWESNAKSAAFIRWVQLFTDLGFTQNRLGFLRDVKFIDGSKMDFISGERNATEIEIKGNDVFWDKEPVTLSIVIMKDESLAVQLLKQNKTFWLYGAGNFQISEKGPIETTYVGNNRNPSIFNWDQKTPEAYSSLYPKLKALAQLK